MKQGIHPDYREVVFQDMATGFRIITRSTANTRETIKMEDGKDYPLFKLDVTSESHPFYTGAQQRVRGRAGGEVPAEIRAFGQARLTRYPGPPPRGFDGAKAAPVALPEKAAQAAFFHG